MFPQGCSTLAWRAVVGGGAWALHVSSPAVLCITQVIPAGVKPGAAAYPHLHDNGIISPICIWLHRANQHPHGVSADVDYMLHWLMQMLVSCVLLWCLGVQCHHLQARRFLTAVDVMQELHVLCEIDMKHDMSFSATRRRPSSCQGSCQVPN